MISLKQLFNLQPSYLIPDRIDSRETRNLTAVNALIYKLFRKCKKPADVQSTYIDQDHINFPSYLSPRDYERVSSNKSELAYNHLIPRWLHEKLSVGETFFYLTRGYFRYNDWQEQIDFMCSEDTISIDHSHFAGLDLVAICLNMCQREFEAFANLLVTGDFELFYEKLNLPAELRTPKRSVGWLLVKNTDHWTAGYLQHVRSFVQYFNYDFLDRPLLNHLQVRNNRSDTNTFHVFGKKPSNFEKVKGTEYLLWGTFEKNKAYPMEEIRNLIVERSNSFLIFHPENDTCILNRTHGRRLKELLDSSDELQRVLVKDHVIMSLE